MQFIQSLIQPIASYVLSLLIGAVVTYLFVVLTPVWKRLNAYVTAHTTADQRAALHRIGQEAFAHAETEWNAYKGEEKLKAAVGYANLQLNNTGMQFTLPEVKAAIHDAWLKYDQAQKAAGLKPPVPTPLPEPVQVPVIPLAARQLIDAAVAFVQDSQQGTKAPVPAAPVEQTPIG